ncbi:MAG TPA: carboxypeptidase regulatory-like domain-containing protein [Candidatus Angelobacter sp.]|nr:carboxypeptidase regulatory-like domain-containing protein [Candidatus Angelobacter sp.]
MESRKEFQTPTSIVLSGLFLFLLAVAAHAQVDYSTATLRGTVTDPQGAVVPGATVTVTNPATGITRTTKSVADGSYQVPALPPASYLVTFEAQGFSKTVVKNLELTVGQTQTYDAHLKVGTLSETIEVSPDSIPLIQTEQSQQANTIDNRQVEDLPNIGRSFTYDVYTVPGVTNSEAPRSQNPGFTGYLTTGFSIGGSNGRNNLSTIDGGENEYGTGQYRVTNLPVDGIQEYQVNRNAFAAEFGFTDGSAINIVTKTGTNLWHGDAFGFFRNQDLEATNFINGVEGFPKAFDQHVFLGGSLGGPLVKDKFFFFTTYEFQKLDTPNFDNATILSAPTVLGISNPLLGNNNPLGNCTTQFAFKIPDQVCYINALKSSGDPFLVGFANGITPGMSPLNNPALNTILHRDNGIFNNPDRLHNAIVRFDYQASPKDTLTLRVGYAHNDFTSPLDGIINGTPDSYGLFVRDFSILSTWTRSISPNLVNQVMVQVVPRNRSSAIPFHENGVNFSLGNLGAPGPGGTSTFGGPALLPYLAHQQRYQFEDNVTATKGAHTFKFGASYRPANYHVENDLWFNPEFDFRDGAIPLISLAPAAVQGHLVAFNLGHGLPATGPLTTNLTGPQSFAFEVPADVIAGFNNPVWEGWGHYFGSYIQDTWKLTSRLTMNAGVRLDFDGEPSPLGTSFYASPRLGFAWDPWGDHKTVIRAGGGIYVAPIDVLIPSYGSLLDGSGRYINQVFGVLSPTDPRVAQLWQTAIALGIYPFGHLTPQQFQQFSTVVNPVTHAVLIPGYDPTAPGASVGYGVQADYKNPYSIQTSLSVTHEVVKDLSVELGYIFYHGVRLQMPVETAYVQTPGTDATGGPLYTSTGQAQHTTYSSIGSSVYHGFTASLTKRFSHGLQFQANYTWSKTIDDVIDFSSFQNWFRPNRLDLFRSTSVFDIPHTFVANAVYQLPFKAGKGNLLSSILADITLSPIVTAHSGLPFSVRTPSLASLPISLGGNGIAPDTNYAMPFHSSRDNNRGAGFYSFDMSFQKALFIKRDRGVRLNLIVQGTNLLNHVNFNKVNDVFDLGGLSTAVPLPNGQTLNLVTGPYTGLKGVVPTDPSQLSKPLFFSKADFPRQVQFGLKLAF